MSDLTIRNCEHLDDYLSKFDNKEKGTKFEEICRKLLYHHPFLEDVNKIEYYSKFIQRKDNGVDLVIIHKNNKKSYVQVKYRKNVKVNLTDISTFISEISNEKRAPDILYSILITNYKVNKEVLKYFNERGENFKIIQTEDFENLLKINNIIIDEKEKIDVKQEKTKIILRNDQADGIIKSIDYFDENKRGCIYLPTGAGKTIYEYLVSSIYLELGKIQIFVLPLISLLHQTRVKLNKYFIQDFEHLNLPTKQLSIVSEEDNKNDSTTSKEEIRKFLQSINRDNSAWIFVTYASLSMLNEIIEKENKNIDFIIFDEAHHTVGNIECKKVMENKLIDKFLYLTATPKFLRKTCKKQEGNKFCMRNESYYGQIIYQLSMRYCIEKNIINKYQLFLSNSNYNLENNVIKYQNREFLSRHLISLGMLINAYKNKYITSCLGFCNSIESCKKLKEIIDNNSMIFSDIKVEIYHSKMKNSDKKEILKKFDKGDINFLISINSLNEGIDIENVDSVIFFDNIKGTINIQQKIGRGLRKKSNNQTTTKIMIPIDKDQIIRGNCLWENLLNIIKVMSKCDETVKHYFMMKYYKNLKIRNSETNDIIFNNFVEINDLQFLKLIGKIEIEVCDEIFKIDRDWYESYFKLKDFYEKYDKYPDQKSEDGDERHLNYWLSSQRTKKTNKNLKDYQIILMKEIHKDIFKYENEIRWMKNYNNLKLWYETYKSLPRGSKYNDVYQEKLRSWLNNQKQAKLNQKMSKKREMLLKQIDKNIFEDKTELKWFEMYQKFKDWYEINQRTPKGISKDILEMELFNWSTVQKRNYRNKNLWIDRIELMKQINEEILENVKQMNWDKKFEKYVLWNKNNNNKKLDKNTNDEEEKILYFWNLSNKKFYENCRLNINIIRLLNGISPSWKSLIGSKLQALILQMKNKSSAEKYYKHLQELYNQNKLNDYILSYIDSNKIFEGWDLGLDRYDKYDEMLTLLLDEEKLDKSLIYQMEKTLLNLRKRANIYLYNSNLEEPKSMNYFNYETVIDVCDKILKIKLENYSKLFDFFNQKEFRYDGYEELDNLEDIQEIIDISYEDKSLKTEINYEDFRQNVEDIKNIKVDKKRKYLKESLYFICEDLGIVYNKRDKYEIFIDKIKEKLGYT